MVVKLLRCAGLVYLIVTRASSGEVRNDWTRSARSAPWLQENIESRRTKVSIQVPLSAIQQSMRQGGAEPAMSQEHLSWRAMGQPAPSRKLKKKPLDTEGWITKGWVGRGIYDYDK